MANRRYEHQSKDDAEKVPPRERPALDPLEGAEVWNPPAEMIELPGESVSVAATSNVDVTEAPVAIAEAAGSYPLANSTRCPTCGAPSNPHGALRQCASCLIIFKVKS